MSRERADDHSLETTYRQTNELGKENILERTYSPLLSSIVSAGIDYVQL
jgi:hypothetical protein